MRTSVPVAGICLLSATLTMQQDDPVLRSLVESERAFAKMSVQTTQREAFLANFAADGVSFEPGPVNARAAWEKRPRDPAESASMLDWEPATGDVAASGDLGYTTGPFAVTSRAAAKVTRQGWYFSVWGRQGRGPWRVLADFGVASPPSGALRPQTFTRATVQGVPPSGPTDAEVVRRQILDLERGFGLEVGRKRVAGAYEAIASDDVRIYRPGKEPIVGKGAVVGYLSGAAARLAWQPGVVGVSAAGDLAYTYGAYEAASDGGGAGTNGFYLHVWKRLPQGWMLAVEVTNVTSR